MRSSLALIATAGLVAVVLSGCAATPAPEAGAGQSSDAIVVKGDFGKAPRVDFPTPLAPEETQCTEVIAGEGDLLVEGQVVLVGYAIYNGASGEELQVAGFEGDPLPIAVSDSTIPGLRKGLTCAREGSRVAIVMPAEDAFGPDGNPSQGMEAGDSLVAVVDVERAFPTRAAGAVRLSRDGFPAVVLAPDGRPGITVPKSDPPEHLEVELLKEGAGPVVEDGDNVVVHYTGVRWDDNSVVESTWERKADGSGGDPAIFVVGDDGPVFSDALVGQKVGSQIGVIVPPSEGDPENSALFFVIDILGVY